MTEKEQAIINKEKKQLKAFIGCLRTESDAIGKQLSSMISIIASVRANQLGINVILTELEKKLEK